MLTAKMCLLMIIME